MNFKKFLEENTTFWSEWEASAIVMGWDNNLTTLFKTAFEYRFKYEEMIYEKQEFLDRMLLSVASKDSEIFAKLYNEMVSILAKSNDELLYDRYLSRFLDVGGNNTYNELTRPLDMSAISNGVSDFVTKNQVSTTEDENINERRNMIIENFNKLYAQFINVLKAYVETFAYLFRETF